MLRFRFLVSLRFQIIMAILTLVITAVMLMGLLVTYLSRNFIIEEKKNLGVLSASLIQQGLAHPTPAEAQGGPEGLQRQAERITMEYFNASQHHSITFFNNRHEIIWSTLRSGYWPYAKVFGQSLQFPIRHIQTVIEQDPASGEDVMVIFLSWRIDGNQVGTVQIVQPLLPPEKKFLFSGKLVVAFAAGYAGVVILFGILLLTQMVILPIQNLNRGVRRLMAGERNFHIPEGDPNEIGQLAQSFNEMGRQLVENENRQAEQIKELLEVNEELELTRRGLIRTEKLASIGRLAAGVAHEVGNPLSAIRGYIDLLMDGDIDEESQRDVLLRMQKDATRIHHIIRGLLDYSRSQKEQVKRHDLNAVIEETIDLIQPQKQLKRITFDFISHKRPALVRIDANQVQQVLVNLFLNASHAMGEEGSITIFLERMIYDPTVTFRQFSDNFRPGQALISLSLIDQGTGMSEELQARIFDPFFTTKEIGSGTGLGLSVVDKIIDTFGGVITVASEENAGAAFTILLPEDPEPQKVQESVSAENSTEETSSTKSDEEEEIPEFIG